MTAQIGVDDVGPLVPPPTAQPESATELVMNHATHAQAEEEEDLQLQSNDAGDYEKKEDNKRTFAGEDPTVGHDTTGGVRAFGGKDGLEANPTAKYYQTQYPVSLPNVNVKSNRVIHVRKNSCGNSSTSQIIRNNNSHSLKQQEEGDASVFDAGQAAIDGLFAQDGNTTNPGQEEEEGVNGTNNNSENDGGGGCVNSLDDVDADAVQDFTDFLDSYYDIPMGGMSVGAAAPIPGDIDPIVQPNCMPQSQQQQQQANNDLLQSQGQTFNGDVKLKREDIGGGGEGRRNNNNNVHEVYKGRIQKKVSNPLHGALQAAMAASSSHTLQYDPLQYGIPAEFQQGNATAAGQDDMCTPQSQLQPQSQEVYATHQGHRLERRHSHHFGVSHPNQAQQQQQQEVYHGSPIGMTYERAPHPEYLPRHHSLDRDVMQQHLYDSSKQQASGANMWRGGQSLSANTNSSGQHTSYTRDSHLKPFDNKVSDVFRSSTSNTTATTGSIGARGPRGSSSRYRGVTQHRRTKRWEAHVWDKGKQVYLGGFESEHRAGRAYDVVVLKTRGADRCQTNFPINEYASVIPYLNSVTRDELVLLLRRRSKGFSRGSSKYIGVTKHKCGKWEARISNSNKSMNNVKNKRKDHKTAIEHESNSPLKQSTSDDPSPSTASASDVTPATPPQTQAAAAATSTRKYTYLGLYETELEAARVHDRAAVALFGLHAHTNFDVCSYREELLMHNPGMKEMGMLKLFQGITHELLH
jgi:AP2-like factor (euAP2 lineage)